MFRTAFQTFRKDQRGNIALSMALGLPILAALGGFAVDYSMWVGQSTNIHAAADAASLAAARELTIASATTQRVQAIAENVVKANIEVPKGFGGDYTTTSEILENGAAIAVTVVQTKVSYFSGAVGINPGTLTARSVARIVGGGKICVVALEKSASKSMYFEKNSKLTGVDCGVYSNAASKDGLALNSGAEVVASLVCSAGGIKNTGGSIKPREGVTDCPPIADPLLARTLTSTSGGGCNPGFKLKSGTKTLLPGRYCGKIEIRDNASVTLSPGLYQFEDRLTVDKNAELLGSDVSLIFKGDKASFDFMKNARIELSARTSGPFAGILFWQDPASLTSKACWTEEDEDDDDDEDAGDNGYDDESDKDCSALSLIRFKIRADRARLLVGTIYLPAGSLFVDSKKPIADLSPWTAVIVRQFELHSGPNIQLNTNYSLTTVPVPTSLAKNVATAKVYLEK